MLLLSNMCSTIVEAGGIFLLWGLQFARPHLHTEVTIIYFAWVAYEVFVTLVVRRRLAAFAPSCTSGGRTAVRARSVRRRTGRPPAIENPVTRGRFTAFSLTVVVLIAAAVFGLPRARRWGEARLRRSLESRATAVFGGPVRIARVRIEFVPPGLLLEGVQAEREGNRGSQAIAAADEVSVHASPLTLLAARRGRSRSSRSART